MDLISLDTFAGPPAGVTLSPEQIATFKEAGVRATFLDAGLGDSIGPFVMGFVFNLMLLGVLFAQVAHWATWAKKERRFIRIIVYWVLIHSVASSIFVVAWVNHLFVERYGKFAQFVDNGRFSWLPVIDQTVIVACQLFNLERSYRINGNRKWVLILISPFMLATTSLMIARRIVASVNGNPEFDAAKMLRPYTYAYLFTNVVTDILLTVSIAHGLWRSKTGWKHTDNVIKRIIVYTIKSQLPPAIAATVIAVQYAINYQTFMVFLYMMNNSKIPAVMLMAVLNFRFELHSAKPTAHRMSSSTALVGSHINGFTTESKRNIVDLTHDIPMLDRYDTDRSTWRGDTKPTGHF